MTERKQITEEEGIHKQWFEDANKQTLETLPEFLRHLSEDYSHDYGTICHALSASALATAWAMNRTPEGGITGFQAGAVMWSFIKHWMHMKGPMRLIEYNDLLFPQYADKFNTISRNTWDAIQKMAAENLQSNEHAHENVIAHWRSIVSGAVPFGLRIVD